MGVLDRAVCCLNFHLDLRIKFSMTSLQASINTKIRMIKITMESSLQIHKAILSPFVHLLLSRTSTGKPSLEEQFLLRILK